MAADKFKEMLDQEMSVLPKTISKHFTDTYYGMEVSNITVDCDTGFLQTTISSMS